MPLTRRNEWDPTPSRAHATKPARKVGGVLGSASEGRRPHSARTPTSGCTTTPKDDARGAASRTNRGAELKPDELTASQLEIYAALFGGAPAGALAEARASAASPPSSPPKPAGESVPLLSPHSPVRAWERTSDAASPASGRADGSASARAEVDREVRKALRGVALERQQAVQRALAEAEAAHGAAMADAREVARREKDAAVAEAEARAAAASAAELQRAERHHAKEREKQTRRVAEAAEKARDVAWAAKLEQQARAPPFGPNPCSFRLDHACHHCRAEARCGRAPRRPPRGEGRGAPPAEPSEGRGGG